jgi:hypothetical protein
MPIITVTHTVRTFFEVPEGFSIEEIRAEFIGQIDDGQSEAQLREHHKGALESIYDGKIVGTAGETSSIKVIEGYERI